MLAPFLREIFPCPITLDNQFDFLFAAPGLDLSLARNRVSHGFKCLKPDQPVNAVLPREHSAFSSLVSQHAQHQCSGYADIEHAALARHHVNVIATRSWHAFLYSFALSVA